MEVVMNMSLLTNTLLQRLYCWPVTVGNGVKPQTHTLDQTLDKQENAVWHFSVIMQTRLFKVSSLICKKDRHMHHSIPAE